MMMLTKNRELDSGKTHSERVAVDDAPPSSTSPNPYKRRGFLRRKSPQPRRKFNLGNSRGEGVTGIRSPLVMSPSHQYPHDHASTDVYKVTTDSQDIFSPRAGSPLKFQHGSPASSRSTSPHKRPWYPAGARPSSRESSRSGRGGTESTYVVHPTFRHLFEERANNGAATTSLAPAPVDGQSRVDHDLNGPDIGNAVSTGDNRSPRKIFAPSKHRPSGKGNRGQQNPQDSVVAVRGRVRDLQSRGRPRSQEREKMLPKEDSGRLVPMPTSSVVLIGHHEQLLALAFDKDILFSAAADGTAKAWDTYSHQCLATYEGHRRAVWGIQVTKRTLITGSADGTVRFWDIETAQPLHVIDLHAAVRDVMVVGDFLAVATTNPGIEVVDLKRMKPYGRLEGHLLAVSALASIEGDGRLVSGSHDTFIRVWDPETRNCEAVLSGHGGTIGALCTLFSRRPPVVSEKPHHGREKEIEELLIVSGSGDSTVRVWGRAGDGKGMREWTCRAVLKGHRHGVWAVHGSSLLGVFATGGGDATVKIWAQRARADVVDREGGGDGVIDGIPSDEHGGQLHQQWECVGGVRGTAGAVGTVLINEQALTFGTSEALIARFPLQLCMPAR